MRAVWDPRKAKANFSKHGVRFSDAEGVLFDPLALTREDTRAEGEARFVSIGADFVSNIVVVVYADQGEDFRLVSARRASRGERHLYEEGIRF